MYTFRLTKTRLNLLQQGRKQGYDTKVIPAQPVRVHHRQAELNAAQSA